MVITKKIFVIEIILAPIIIGYVYTSLLMYVHYASNDFQIIEMRYWFSNIMIAFSLCLIFIAIHINISKRKGRSNSTPLPITTTHTEKEQIMLRSEKAYLIFLTINWIVLMPVFSLIFYFIFKMNLVLISIIIIVWSNLTFFLLLYIKIKKNKMH